MLSIHPSISQEVTKDAAVLHSVYRRRPILRKGVLIVLVLGAALLPSTPASSRSKGGPTAAATTYAGSGCTVSMVFLNAPIAAVRPHVPAQYAIRQPGTTGMTMVIAGIWECAGLVLSPGSLGRGSISFLWVAIESPIGTASPGGGDFYELWRLTDLPKLSSALAAKGHLSPVVKGMDVSTTPLAVSDLIEWVVPWTAENYAVRAATTGELDPHAGVRVRLWHGGGTRVLQQDIVETAGSSATASQSTGVLTATPGGVLSKMEVTGRPAVVFLFTDRSFRSTLQNTRPG